MAEGLNLSDLKIDTDKRVKKTGGIRLFVYIFTFVIASSAIALIIYSLMGSVEVSVVTAQEVSAEGGSAVLNASGYVTARRKATVAAKITGRVTDVLVEEGDSVKKGQIIARLDDSEAKAGFEEASFEYKESQSAKSEIEVNLRDAERDLTRIKGLYENGVAGKADLDHSEAKAESLTERHKLSKNQTESAKARIKLANEALSNCTILAPFDGVVISKDAQRGEVVSPMSSGGFTRTGLATIVDMHSLEIEVDVNESNISGVMVGQRVDATLDAYPDWHVSAKVKAIIPAADRQKATIKVRISFESLDPRILPDMGVKVSFLGDENSGKRSGYFLIPRDAVMESEGKSAIFVLNGNRIERRAVAKGREKGGMIEILSGINDGDKIIIKPSENLHDGQKVKIKSENEN